MEDCLLTEQFDVLFRDALWWLGEIKSNFSGNAFFSQMHLSNTIFNQVLRNARQSILMQLKFNRISPHAQLIKRSHSRHKY